MKGDTHFGKDENLPLRYAYFHVHFNIIHQNFSRPPKYRHKEFHLWVSPGKGSGISEVPLRGLMETDDQGWKYVEFRCEWESLWDFSPGVQFIADFQD